MKISRTRFIVALTERDVSTVRLAALTGLSRGTISAVKNGKRCSDDTALRIAQALAVPVESLLEEGRSY